jgi:hypothetical protein
VTPNWLRSQGYFDTTRVPLWCKWVCGESGYFGENGQLEGTSPVRANRTEDSLDGSGVRWIDGEAATSTQAGYELQGDAVTYQSKNEKIETEKNKT